MAPLPPVPNVVKLQVITTFESSLGADLHQCLNTFHVAFTGVAGVNDMNAMAAASDLWWTKLMDGTGTGGSTYISQDLHLRGTRCTDLTSSTAAFGSDAVNVVGGASQQSLANAALVASGHVGRRFRGGHSRVYIAGLTGDNSADSRLWLPIAVSDITNWFTNWRNVVLTNHGMGYPNIVPSNFVQVSYVNKTVNPVPPYRRPVPVVDGITGWTLDQVIRSQRRRVRLSPTPS